LGWAEVRHPFHPLKGQRFPVLKRRRWAGKETLILGHPEHGSFGILCEWTDWGALTECADGTTPSLRLDVGMLLELLDLIDLLGGSTARK
jgi:hypothetical protein